MKKHGIEHAIGVLWLCVHLGSCPSGRHQVLGRARDAIPARAGVLALEAKVFTALSAGFLDAASISGIA